MSPRIFFHIVFFDLDDEKYCVKINRENFLFARHLSIMMKNCFLLHTGKLSKDNTVKPHEWNMLNGYSQKLYTHRKAACITR